MKRLTTAALLLMALATSVNLSFPQQAKADHDDWREHNGWYGRNWHDNGFHRGWYNNDMRWRHRYYNRYNYVNPYVNPWSRWGTRSDYYPYGY